MRALIPVLPLTLALMAPAASQTVLQTAADLFAGDAVHAGAETESTYTYKPSLDDLIAMLKDPTLKDLSASLGARGVTITVTSALSQPERCLFEIQTSLVAPGVFAGTLSTSIDLQNAKGVSTRKRPDGSPEGIILGDADFTCSRFSITAKNAPFDPGRAKCDNVNATAPIDKDKWIAVARDMSAKYCPLGKFE